MNLRLILLCLLLPPGISAQETDMNFLFYLSSRAYHEEVVYLTSNAHEAGLSQATRDSLHYLRGWSLYSLKRLDESCHELLRVSPQSGFHTKSRFFAAYNQVYLGRNDKARLIIDSIQDPGIETLNLRSFMRAGMELLESDHSQVQVYAQETNADYYAITREMAHLRLYSQELSEHRKRSPLMAGMMSAIVPGSGKMYAGKPLQGLSALITVAGLGLVTRENYNKLGPKNIKTIVFGSMFTAFYIANIYGAVFAVRIAENEFQDEYRNKILFDLHIPLRTVFN